MNMMRPRVVLLREGTDTSQGKGQLLSNINACEAVTAILKTTLGPLGMDKLIHTGGSATISNDGATIIDLLDIVHPAAKILVDIAKSQDDMVGDGTTSVCLIAGELLSGVKSLVEDGLHPQIIMAGFKQACEQAIKIIGELEIEVKSGDTEKMTEMLMNCAGTALNSKLICRQKEFFSKMAVDACASLDDRLDLKMIGVKKVPGGSVTDSFLTDGVAFKKTFSYAGFEQQPKAMKDPKIVCLNVELELKSERQDAEIRLKDPDQYQSIVDAEWNIIYDKLDKIQKSGAKIVLSKLPVGDLATQYFADRDVFCAGRVAQEDLNRVTEATGATIQTSLNDLNPSILGTCGNFVEQQVGSERFNIFSGCPETKTATIVLRGGSEQYIAETERSLHDAIMIVKRAMTHSSIVGGGGAIEMELSKRIREHARTIKSKTQLVVSAYAKALEIIPRQLAENAGFDSTNIINELRGVHAKGVRVQPQDAKAQRKQRPQKSQKPQMQSGVWMGVNIEEEGVCDTLKSFVWEPALVKRNALAAATEAACMILSVDETIKAPERVQPGAGGMTGPGMGKRQLRR